MSTLFQNIEQIEGLCQFLVSVLENAVKYWTPASGVGAVLIPHVLFANSTNSHINLKTETIASAYCSYMENYDKAARLLSKLLESQRFAEFTNVCLSKDLLS